MFVVAEVNRSHHQHIPHYQDHMLVHNMLNVMSDLFYTAPQSDM